MGDLLSEAPIEKPKPLTAHQVRIALASYYTHPNHGIVFEVAKATGFSANRHLDAVAMSLWPSRGLDLYGIEIKVSRQDYRREIENPQKAEEIAQFLDYFYIAAPTGMVPIDSLPKAWGLLEVSDGKVKERIPATRTAAKDGGRAFLAAIFRAAGRPSDPAELDELVQQRLESLDRTIEERVTQRVADRHDREHAAAENWKKLCAELGENWTWKSFDGLIGPIKAAQSLGLNSQYGDKLTQLRTQLNTSIRALDSFMEVVGAKGAEE